MTSSVATFKVVTVKDFDKVCRTCLGEEQLGPIKGTLVSDFKVKELLEYSVMIEWNESDFLPQNICENCLITLYKIYEFKKLCQNNNTLLRVLLKNDLLEQSEIKEEYSDVTLMEEHKEYEEKSTGDLLEEDKEYKENSTGESNCVEVKNESIENAPEIYQCEDCDFTSPCKEVRFAHCKQAQHGQFKKFKCEFCDETFVRSKMSRHMRSHSKERPYQCDMCPQRFSAHCSLSRHKKKHTGERPHECDICGQRFSRSDYLHAHKKKHETNHECNRSTNNVRFMCNVCGRGFKRPAPYHAHLETHNSKENKSEKKQQSGDYLCEICAHAFRNIRLLKQHKLIHGEKSFLCSACGKAFATRASLLLHSSVHTGERPYKCPVCQKHFRHLSSLNTHMLSHKGFKSYKCTQCPKSFIISSHLRRHLKTHTGEKPHTCTFCSKSFALKENLAVHIRIHTRETPFECPVCGKGFRDSSTMRKHRQRHQRAGHLEEVGAKEQPRPQLVEDDISVKSEESLICENPMT